MQQPFDAAIAPRPPFPYALRKALGVIRYVRTPRAISQPQRRLLVSWARATRRPCVRYTSSERAVWRPSFPHRARRVPARRECTGAASIVALDRNTGGGAAVCLKARE